MARCRLVPLNTATRLPRRSRSSGQRDGLLTANGWIARYAGLAAPTPLGAVSVRRGRHRALTGGSSTNHPDANAAMLANFKVPKKVVVVKELPRNTMGKVQKNLLRDEHRGSFIQK